MALELASHQFLSEPDDALKCLICLDVAQDPWQHSKCGRLYCRECIERYGMTKPCPTCKMERPQYFEDNRSKREIRCLRVKCDYHNRKCGWVGALSDLHKHMATCRFKPDEVDRFMGQFTGDAKKASRSFWSRNYGCDIDEKDGADLETPIKVRSGNSGRTEADAPIDHVGDYFSRLVVTPKHPRHRCDGCRMFPIEGRRFHCKVCPDFDFCESCFDGGSSHAHIFERINNNGDSPVYVGLPGGQHPRHRCDGCKKFPIEGPRFHCRSCPDFDFCQSCFYGNLDHKHVFERVDDVGHVAVCVGCPGGHHRRYTCDGCREYPIQGLRFHCKTCPDFDFCRRCFRNNRVHRHLFERINTDGEKAMPVGYPRATEIHPRHGCDRCRMSPILGPRFHCEVCPDFDFCEDCFNTHSRSHSHHFVRVSGQKLR